jgi:acetylornithine/N-succinyldiaminopimelate aminotransferase
MGRTGSLFAYEQSGIAPDIMPVAKGLGGGFPVGACLATEKAARGMTAGAHGSTFGGNPLAMAAAEAVLDVVLQPGFLAEVAHWGEVLRTKLADLPARFPHAIEAVRGAGMMIGLKCRMPNTELQAKLLANGLLTIGAGDNVVRLLPPLIIREREIEEALDILSRTLSEVTP